MLIRTTIALALILASASGSLAAQKKHSTSPSYDVYDTRGHYVGSDPDPFIRGQLARDHGSDY